MPILQIKELERVGQSHEDSVEVRGEPRSNCKASAQITALSLACPSSNEQILRMGSAFAVMMMGLCRCSKGSWGPLCRKVCWKPFLSSQPEISRDSSNEAGVFFLMEPSDGPWSMHFSCTLLWCRLEGLLPSHRTGISYSLVSHLCHCIPLLPFGEDFCLFVSNKPNKDQEWLRTTWLENELCSDKMKNGTSFQANPKVFLWPLGMETSREQ